jgi:hypothetical protein
MKKLFVLLIILSSKFSFCQTLPDFDNIKLDKSTDYKDADSFALNSSTYLLSTPFEKNDLSRLKALQFIIKWMSGTPDYTFTLDGIAGKIIKENDDLLGLYMAAMTKFCLENKSSSGDANLVKLNAVKFLLMYCENSANNMKMTKQLQKLSDANKKGELEKSL